MQNLSLQLKLIANSFKFNKLIRFSGAYFIKQILEDLKNKRKLLSLSNQIYFAYLKKKENIKVKIKERKIRKKIRGSNKN